MMLLATGSRLVMNHGCDRDIFCRNQNGCNSQITVTSKQKIQTRLETPEIFASGICFVWLKITDINVTIALFLAFRTIIIS